MRRKGEKPVNHRQFYQPYDNDHPVARAIRSGSRWFEAWQFQHCRPNAELVRKTGIAPDRLEELRHGAAVAEGEVAVLAAAYGVQPSDIIASLPDHHLLLKG